MNDYSKITALYSRLSVGARTGTAAKATPYRTKTEFVKDILNLSEVS